MAKVGAVPLIQFIFRYFLNNRPYALVTWRLNDRDCVKTGISTKSQESYAALSCHLANTLSCYGHILGVKISLCLLGDILKLVRISLCS